MVVAYFTNFAKTGDPNGVTDLGQQLPTWPQTRGSDPSRPAEDLVLRVAGADEGDITVLNEYHGEACEMHTIVRRPHVCLCWTVRHICQVCPCLFHNIPREN